MLAIPVNARWAQNGVTVAGGKEHGVTVPDDKGHGNKIEYLAYPYGLFVNDDETLVVCDSGNHRIVQWKKGSKLGQVVAGGNGKGTKLNQLNWPSDVLIDKQTDNLIISDRENRRVMRWSRRHDTKEGEILIDNITCWALAMDEQGDLYVSDSEKHEVRRYRTGDNKGIVVAGGNGKGDRLNQLNYPTFIFVDQQQTIYVSDRDNNRVMRWNKGASEGIILAGYMDATEQTINPGCEGYRKASTQLYYPNGLVVDTSRTLYVVDLNNDRVMRWSEGEKQGTVIVAANGSRKEADHFEHPSGLSFDRDGNLYVAEPNNHRVKRFSILREEHHPTQVTSGCCGGI